MDFHKYLTRIGVGAPPNADLETLELLQRAHLTAVPFENLHIFHRRGVETSIDWSIPKIVEDERGGWCFELNGAFASLLSAVGFEVKLLAATVLYGRTSSIPTHLTIEVRLDRPYLVDVGFGDSFIRPLPLDTPGPHDGGSGSYGFDSADGTTTLVSHEEGKVVEHYRFDREARKLTDFDEASTYLQTEPGLQWTESPFATRLLDCGPNRVTLLEDRLKFRRDGQWTEHPITASEWPSTLQRWFGMTP